MLDLTQYEIGKAVWNDLPHGRQDKQILFERYLEFLDEMNVLGVHGMEQDVADTAVSKADVLRFRIRDSGRAVPAGTDHRRRRHAGSGAPPGNRGHAV